MKTLNDKSKNSQKTKRDIKTKLAIFENTKNI